MMENNTGVRLKNNETIIRVEIRYHLSSRVSLLEKGRKRKPPEKYVCVKTNV